MEQTQAKLLCICAELFAQRGYSGVSMRDIARETGITQAAIYHHFSSKEELYLAAMESLYADHTADLIGLVEQQSDPELQLALIVSHLLKVFDEHTQFRRIYFRELLDGDQKRLRLLAEGLFKDIDQFLRELMDKLAPHMDSHLLLLDLAGLLLHHLEARKLSALLDTGRPEHQDPNYLADHITKLLLNGVRKS